MSNIDKAIYIIELNKAMREQVLAANDLVDCENAFNHASKSMSQATLHFDACNLRIKELNAHPVFGNKVTTEITNLNKPIAL